MLIFLKKTNCGSLIKLVINFFISEILGYHWDDYDMRGSRTLVSCGGEGATAAPPDLLMLNEGTSLVHGDDPMEGLPLLPCEISLSFVCVHFDFTYCFLSICALS